MKLEQLTGLTGSYCAFMRDAGLVQWDLTGEVHDDDITLGRTLAALADIEADSRYMQVKLRQAGLLRRTPLRDFNSQWLCEEQEHSTVLRAMASLHGVQATGRRHDLAARDRRSVFAMVTLRIGRLAEDALAAAYLTLGMAQEHIAISTYTYLSAIAPSQNQSSILRNIARQEGRHMRFFRTGSETMLMSSSPFVRVFVRSVLEQYWRPPGVDLLGREAWHVAFAPVLADPRARSRLLGVDRTLSALPGLENLNLMETFLATSRRKLATKPGG